MQETFSKQLLHINAYLSFGIIKALSICQGCTKTVVSSDYDAQLQDLLTEYKPFDAQAPRFFLFGMGNRNKYVYKDFKLLSVADGSVACEFSDALNDSIMPADYRVSIETAGGVVNIYEDEAGIWVEAEGKVEQLPGSSAHVSLPSFENFKYGQVLRVLLHEKLFNVKDGKIYPNLFVCRQPFYRDAFMAALCLEKTGNTILIAPWISNEENIYDMQNSEAEGDNLGQMLYMLSFVPDTCNLLLRRRLKAEIEKRTVVKDGFKYIYGNTDGAPNAEYATQI